MPKRSSITLTVIRCGETTWEAQGRVHGVTDLPLSDAGREMIVQALPLLAGAKAASIHHPTDEAAAATARLCGPLLGGKLREASELNDPNMGLLEGLTEQEFAERFRSRHKQWKEDPITLSPPEGEDVQAAAERIFHGVARIIRRSRGDEVAIVLHAMGCAMLRCWVSGKPLACMREMDEAPMIERFVITLDSLDALEQAGVLPTAQS